MGLGRSSEQPESLPEEKKSLGITSVKVNSFFFNYYKAKVKNNYGNMERGMGTTHCLMHFSS